MIIEVLDAGGAERKLSWQEWHDLGVRGGNNWREKIQNLPLVTLKRLANGVVGSDGFSHVEACFNFANDLENSSDGGGGGGGGKASRA